VSDIQFTKIAWEEYVSWQTKDRKTIKKINRLIKSILRDGALAGEGKPEKLKYRDDECSRRIDDKNRLTYRCLENGKVEILSCEGHYGNDS
jgi:toxin YoeB